MAVCISGYLNFKWPNEIVHIVYPFASIRSYYKFSCFFFLLCAHSVRRSVEANDWMLFAVLQFENKKKKQMQRENDTLQLIKMKFKFM